LALAVMIALSSAAMVATVTVNPAVVALGTIVTVAGTAASALLLDSVTKTPPDGAGPLNVTVQVDVPGALTVDGAHEMPLSERPAVKVTGALALCPFKVAVSAAVCPVVIVPAIAVNVVFEALLAIVMLAGTVSAAVLLDKATVTAFKVALFSVTVQTALWPVPSVLGEQLSEESWASETRFSVVVRLTLLALAVMVAV
jgi:hypothetical protein